MNFIGFGSPNPMLELAGQMKSAGKMIGPCVIINQPDAVAQLRNFTSNLIVYRVKGEGRNEPSPYDFEGRRWTAKEWVARWSPSLMPGTWAGKPYALCFCNEVWQRGLAAFFRDFYLDLMTECTRLGITCTVLNTSVQIFDERDYPMLRPVIAQAQRQGHYVGFNTYWNPSDPDGWKYFLNLINEFPEALWYIQEWGFMLNDATYMGRDELAALLARVTGIQHKGLVGWILWCLNGAGGGWPHSNIPSSDFPIIVAGSR